MKEAPSVSKIISLVLKAICLIVIFGVIAILLIRIIMADYYPKRMKSLYPSAELAAACEADPTLAVRRQELRISYDDPNYSLFMASNQFYCPETGEFQITLRYNVSTLAEMQKDFALSEIPEPDPALFDFSLVDNNGNRTPLSCVWTESKFMYQYMKLVTSDLDFSLDPGWIRVEIYYKGAVDYAEDAYSRIPVYEKELIAGDTVYVPTAEELAPWQ
jgi:hypothetical protein